MKGHMIDPTLATKLDASIRNAVRSVLDNAEDFEVSHVRELIQNTERRLEELASLAAQYAGEVSAAAYELETLDTSDVLSELQELAKLFPASNADNS